MNPFLICTDEYGRFAPYAFNRNISRVEELMKSMKRFGFHPGSPIDCVPAKDGMLKIRQGHHRFHVAQSLGIKLYAIVNDHEIPAHELEIPSKAWTLKDFIVAHSKTGSPEMTGLIEYSQDNNISLNMAAGLLSGVIGASLYRSDLKTGEYKAKERDYADRIADIVSQIKDIGVNFASNTNFVKAIARCVRIPSFDPQRLCKKCKSHPYLVQKCASVFGYMEMIEFVYNRQCNSSDKLAVVVEADKAMRLRRPNIPAKTSR